MKRQIVTVDIHFDVEANVWWGSCQQLYLSTQGNTQEELKNIVLELAPECIADNNLPYDLEKIEWVFNLQPSAMRFLHDDHVQKPTSYITA